MACDVSGESDPAELGRKAENDNRAGTKRERLDPPVGTDGPDADREKTVAVEDLNSADDK